MTDSSLRINGVRQRLNPGLQGKRVFNDVKSHRHTYPEVFLPMARELTTPKSLPLHIPKEHLIAINRYRKTSNQVAEEQLISERLREVLKLRTKLSKPELLLVEKYLQDVYAIPEEVKQAILGCANLQEISSTILREILNEYIQSSRNTELQESIKTLLQKHLNDLQGLPPYIAKLIGAGFEIESMFEPNLTKSCNTKGECVYVQTSDLPRLNREAYDYLFKSNNAR